MWMVWSRANGHKNDTSQCVGEGDYGCYCRWIFADSLTIRLYRYSHRLLLFHCVPLLTNLLSVWLSLKSFTTREFARTDIPYVYQIVYACVCVCVCVTNWWPNDVCAMNIECHLIYVCIYNNWIHLSYCYDMWERKWRKRNRRFFLFTSIIFFQVAISTITNIDWLPLKINNSLAMSLHLSPSFVCIRNHIPAIDSQNNCIRKYTFRIYFDVFV